MEAVSTTGQFEYSPASSSLIYMYVTTVLYVNKVHLSVACLVYMVYCIWRGVIPANLIKACKHLLCPVLDIQEHLYTCSVAMAAGLGIVA